METEREVSPPAKGGDFQHPQCHRCVFVRACVPVRTRMETPTLSTSRPNLVAARVPLIMAGANLDNMSIGIKALHHLAVSW